MVKIDFNSSAFTCFEEGEDILLDTGIILAYLNSYDSWHNTVFDLFNNYIVNNESTVFLYVNPTMINEVTFLADRPMKQYADVYKKSFINIEFKNAKNQTISSLAGLIEDNIIIVLDGNKESVLKQLKVFETLGSADATFASIANEYAISLLTIDNKFVNNLSLVENDLSDIRNVYFTTSKHRSYRKY